MPPDDLNGKRALITGGAAGIGKAIVEALVERGARVAVGQRQFEKLQPLLACHPAQIVGFHVDVAKPAECQKLVADSVAALGGLDILVNNAAITGVPALKWFLDETVEHVDTTLDTNLKGVIHCSIAAARQMAAQKTGGVIVHISSVAAFGAQQGGAIYCASKAALSGLTQSMAVELARHQIRVVGVAPGDIRIEKSTKVAHELSALERDPRFIAQTPLDHGQPDDIAETVAFLVSDRARFVTGVTWVVDGGLLAY